MKSRKRVSDFLKVTMLLTLSFLARQSLIAQVTQVESFDGATFLPTGWSSVGTTNLWTRRTSGTFPTCTMHSGAGMVRFAARGSAPKTTQTIATPIIDLSNRAGKSSSMSLWIYRDNGSTLGDSLSIYLNTSNSLSGARWLSTIARYSKLQVPDTVATNGWYQYTIAIPTNYNSATNYILLKGIGEAGYNIYIDDIQWEEFPNPCTGTPSAGSIVASTYLICGGTGSSNLTLTNQTNGYSGLSFQWKSSSSTSGPFANFGGNTTTISTGTITATRYYKCVATCSFSGKSDSTSITGIVVSPKPNPVVTITPTAANYCVGSGLPALLKASSTTAKKYLWTPATGLDRNDSSDVKATITVTTNYSVSGTDSLGCVGVALVTVTLRQPPFVTLTATDSILCNGDSVRLTANVGGGGNTFLWSPTGQTVNAIFAKPNQNANYSVSVKNTFGCATTIKKNLFVNQIPKAKFGVTVQGRKVIFSDSSVNALSYEWDFGDGNGSKKQNPSYIFLDDGIFPVRLILNNSPCKADTFIRNVSILLSGIKAKVSNNEFSIAPNPTNDLVTITSPENTKTNLTIINSVGQQVFSKDLIKSIETIDMNPFSNGIYLFKMMFDGKMSTLRVIKKSL